MIEIFNNRRVFNTNQMFLVVASAKTWFIQVDACWKLWGRCLSGENRAFSLGEIEREERSVRRWIGRSSFTMCLTTDDSGPWRAVETKSVGCVVSRQIFHQFAYATLRCDARIIATLHVKRHYARGVTAHYYAWSIMTFRRSRRGSIAASQRGINDFPFFSFVSEAFLESRYRSFDVEKVCNSSRIRKYVRKQHVNFKKFVSASSTIFQSHIFHAWIFKNYFPTPETRILLNKFHLCENFITLLRYAAQQFETK